MAGPIDEPKPLLPALKPFYDFVIPLSWFVVRAAVGWNLLVHGWGKITVGPTPGFLKAFGYWLHASSPVVLDRTVHRNSGRHRANPWIVHAFFFAAAAAIEMLIITAIYWHTGFSWLRQGYEYALLWGWICFAIALRGGGPYSVDRVIGIEL